MKNRIIPVVALIAILAVAFSLMLPRESTAQGSVTVNRQGVENQFPDGLRFYIDAESASDIEEIRVYVRKLGQSSRRTYRTVEFEPGTSISGEALFQSKTSNEYIPTGTRLEYHFDIRTVDGEQFETEPETLVYLNTGLDWDVKSSGLINVYYYQYDQLSEARAEAVLMVADETYQHMGPILGVELTEPMSIVVYSSYDHMREALRPSSRVAARHLRTLGQAFSNERTLLVDGSSDPFVGDNTLTTTAHEFTHLLVADAAGSAYAQVHLWLNEGLAVYSEGQPNNEYERYMEFAIENDRVPPLAGLRTFAGTPQETLQAYGQGHAVASYMLANYDQSLMAELFAAIRTTHNFEKALVAAYGVSVPDLDNEWRESVGLTPRDLSTPPPPPLQVLPTRRQQPANAAPASTAPASTAAAQDSTRRPTPTVAPTYTPKPPPTSVAGVLGPASSGGPAGSGGSNPQQQGGGCGATPEQTGSISTQLASLALLAAPAGLVALARIRRRR
ncbi:MAG: hypothetical protein F4X64_02445 [Chloroflexi bacterium]|nr:hypothetical protein [Chloroflexota bacterium]